MIPLSARARRELRDVHPALVAVVKRAWELLESPHEVIDGIRTIEEQREFVRRGVSRTLKSYHLKQADGYGHAVDIVPWVNGVPKWPNAYAPWKEIERCMKAAAKELGVPVEWGGDWRNRWDKPHWQIPRNFKWSTAPKPQKPAVKQPVKPPKRTGLETVRKGSKGASVTLLQRRLTELKYNVGPADGDFGPRTDGALRDYQSDHGLVADGIAGPKTYAKLFE
jgi:peptidoglycan L-alanyl-D-glutamate endopeptidase CwlK